MQMVGRSTPGSARCEPLEVQIRCHDTALTDGPAGKRAVDGMAIDRLGSRHPGMLVPTLPILGRCEVNEQINSADVCRSLYGTAQYSKLVLYYSPYIALPWLCYGQKEYGDARERRYDSTPNHDDPQRERCRAKDNFSIAHISRAFGDSRGRSQNKGLFSANTTRQECGAQNWILPGLFRLVTRFAIVNCRSKGPFCPN